MIVAELPFQRPADWPAAVERAVHHLDGGGVIAYPTETVYGFGCGLREDSLRELAALKRREPGKPFLILVLHAGQVSGLHWTDSARALAAAFWPGPLTLALRAEPGAFPALVQGPGGTVAVRATPHAGVRALLGAWGEPITSTSANLPGQPPARSVDGVRTTLARLDAAPRVLLLDGGVLAPSAASTIVDCSTEPPRVTRSGAIGTAELGNIIHDLDTRARRT
jgi:L-threonylcarbamoyladenylate synthase